MIPDKNVGQGFVDIAAHQLQEPLAGMKWKFENILSGRFGNLSAEQRGVIVELYDTNENAIQLVSDLLTVARLEGGRLKVNKQPSDLSQLVRKIMKRHDADIKEHRGKMYFTSSKDSLPEVSVDDVLMNQVVDNLISNAIKYNPAKMHITVSVLKDEGFVVISVNNRGPIISKEKQADLFKKFSRAKTKGTEKTSGTGLGLYITKQIVELHSGEISVVSEEKQGTTFTVRLPIEK